MMTYFHARVCGMMTCWSCLDGVSACSAESIVMLDRACLLVLLVHEQSIVRLVLATVCRFGGHLVSTVLPPPLDGAGGIVCLCVRGVCAVCISQCCFCEVSGVKFVKLLPVMISGTKIDWLSFGGSKG